MINRPVGIAIDTKNNVYVADYGNAAIRRVTPDGTVDTIAGMPGEWGNRDGVGNAALFCQPQDVAIDSSGALYVVDLGTQTIRKVELPK